MIFQFSHESPNAIISCGIYPPNPNTCLFGALTHAQHPENLFGMIC